jgi:hypothetical protein
MAKPYNDKKLRLGEPLATMLRDFCTANYNGTALDVIREAVREHIERRIKETVMGERYEKARRERLGLPEKIAQLVKNGKKPE